MENRKAFNFYRSYYEVCKELPKKSRLEFLMGVLEMQFTGQEPKLEGMAKFAFMSQKHSIVRQIEGYKSGVNGGRPPKGSNNPPLKGSDNHTHKGNQNQEKEQEKEQVKEKDKQVPFSFRKSMCSIIDDKILIDDFLKNRKLKKLANTETAFNNLVIEFKKSDLPIKELMTKIVSRGWGSFKNSWLEKEKEEKKKTTGFTFNKHPDLD